MDDIKVWLGMRLSLSCDCPESLENEGRTTKRLEDRPPAEDGLAHPPEEVLSGRLVQLIDDILAGRAPNAGRFCGYCYHPAATGREVCPHCGRATAEWPPAEALPRELLEMQRMRRRREGLVVRSVAWGGLTIGVVVALVPLAFAGVTWWSATLFFVLLLFFYLLSANMANSIGDALGWRWGQTIIRRRWQRLVEERDSTPEANARPS